MVAPPPRGQARAIEREESPCLRSLLVSRALARGQVGAILSPPSSFSIELNILFYVRKSTQLRATRSATFSQVASLGR